MTKPFDATMKQLLDAFGADWVIALAPWLGLPPGLELDPLDVDLSTVQLSADKVFRLRPPSLGILHIEPQSSHDGELPDRMLEYNAALHRRYGGPVYSVAVLLRPEANATALTGELVRQFPDGRVYLRFAYAVVRVWQLPLESLLAGAIGSLPLALLTDAAAGHLREVVDRIDSRLRDEQVPDMVRVLLHTCGYILLGMRYDDSEIQPAFVGIEGMKESTTYQAILREGVQLGRQEGRQEGTLRTLQESLRRVLRKRFVAIPNELDARIAQTADPAKLEDALLQSISIEKPEDLTL